MTQPSGPFHRPPPRSRRYRHPCHAHPCPSMPMHVPMPTPIPTPAKTFEVMRSTVAAEQQHAQSDSPHGISAHVTHVLLTGM